MKYFKNTVGEVYAFESDGSQDDFIPKDLIKMTKKQIDQHLNPEKYMTEDEKYKIYILSLSPLTRRQFMRMLVEFELDETLNNAIDNIENAKERKILKIDFDTIQNFERLSESVINMFKLINIEESKLNSMWEYGLSI